MSIYIVKVLESIGDVVENATGSRSNLDTVLAANGFDTWTPDLAPEQAVTIPDDVAIDTNTKRQLATYPACNWSVNDIYTQIVVLFNLFANNWILSTGFWNDNAVWVDSKTWID